MGPYIEFFEYLMEAIFNVCFQQLETNSIIYMYRLRDI